MPAMTSFELRAMDTAVTVHVPDRGDDATERLAAMVGLAFAEAEARYSRFNPGSELSRLNRASAPMAVSTELLAALLRARRHVACTRGAFDPTIGRALLVAGYDRSFASGRLDRGTPAARPPAPSSLDEVVVDLATGLVTRPAHVQLDLGGMIKGATVDAVAEWLPGPAALDAGGDARLVGRGPDGDGWLVDVEDPDDPQATVLTLRLVDRAIATSAANRRRWRRGDAVAHHLIDPRTGQPARTDLAQVTVVADRAEDAEVLAKAVFVLGRDAGAALLAHHHTVGAILIGRDREVVRLGALEVVDGAA